MVKGLKASKWSQITLCILTNVLTSISERFCPNFEQINIPPQPVGNREQIFDDVWAFLFDMCQVEFGQSAIYAQNLTINTKMVQGPLQPLLLSPAP